MRLHLFNPEHDLALASGSANFTAPHAARQLRAELGFIPALYAEDGDIVAVDDVEAAKAALRHLKRGAADVRLVALSELKTLKQEIRSISAIEPWGWDTAVKKQFLKASQDFAPLLPDDNQIEAIRRLSNRRFAAERLRDILCKEDKQFVGAGQFLTDIRQVEDIVAAGRQWMLKAPWSCSGRGVRYVEGGMTEHTRGWCRNIISAQGGVMIEPYYSKVIDFGMEFRADISGHTEYVGLSLFTTRNGAYTGNVLATERAKTEMLARYVDADTLARLRERVIGIMSGHLRHAYEGCFGIDMMVVASTEGQGFNIHPCVEMNLRRTMGHVAIAASGDESVPQGLMRISFDGAYHLRLRDTNENIVNTCLFA